MNKEVKQWLLITFELLKRLIKLVEEFLSLMNKDYVWLNKNKVMK
jgi:hypothetical protein